MKHSRQTELSQSISRLERASAPIFSPFSHEGDAIVLRSHPVGTRTRLFGAAIAAPLWSLAIYSSWRVLTHAFADPGIPLGGMLLSLVIIGISAIVGLTAAIVALQPVKELRLEPGLSKATLIVRYPAITRKKHCPLARLPNPDLRIQPGGAESSPAALLQVSLPDGAMIETNDPERSFEEQREQAEYWRTLIEKAVSAAR